MEIEIINPTEYPEWDLQVSELPGATFFHTSYWARVMADSYGYTPRYFCTFRNGSMVDTVPMMEIRSLITGKRGVSLPFSDQVEPLITKQAHFDKLLKAIINFGRSRGWKSIAFHGGNSVFKETKSYERFISCKVELDQDHSVLFKQFKSNTKRNIKKAEKSGLTAKICHSLQSVKDFYRLNCLTRRDHGLPPQPYSFFHNIYKNIIQPKKGFVCLGYSEGRPISGVVFLMFKDKAVYKYGASDKHYFKLRPNNLVFWEALKYASSLGCSTVDLGRTELHHKGLLQFKRGWNPVETEYDYFKYRVSSGNFFGAKKRIAFSHAIMTKLPIGILRLAGSLLYKHVA